MRTLKLTGLAFLAGALVAPIGGAVAQEEGAEPVEEIITTGSRIARKDLTGSAAVTVLDEEAIRVTGNVSIGDVLQDLTVNANAINVQFNNGGNGATRVNLRGIGATRTLTLLNGRRMVGTAGSSSVDLNAIPLSVIERVEVLKDGASAVYGSDAVAGVVNIITRTDFDGVEMNAFVGQSGEGDGEIMDFNVTFGVANDKGNILVSAGYYEQQDIFSGERDFGFFDQTYDWDTGTPGTTGSTGTPEGTIIDWSLDPGNAAWQQVVADCPSEFCWNGGNTVSGWEDFSTAGTSDVGAGSLYNYQPINYLLTPQKRMNIYMAGNYELSPMVNAFIEGHYLNRHTEQLLAPTPLFIISEGVTVSSANYYNPYGRDFIDIRRRFLEAGGRNFLQDVDTFRVVGGLQGEFPGDKGWGWEAYLNYGQTDQQSTGLGRFIRSRVINAIGPSADLDLDGTPECYADAAYTQVIPGCVPLDLFGGAFTRPMTDDQIGYIAYEGTSNQYQTQRTYGLNFSGDLFDMPAGPMGMAIGFEYREERGGDIPDPITNSGDTTGNKREITRGSFDVTEAYLEFLVPIFEGFELSAAVRHSDYSAFGTTTNGKIGLIWDIGDTGLTLRGTVSEAFRAPTINDLFGGNSDSFPAASDPCDTGLAPRTVNEDINCTADGLAPDYVDARTQLKTTVGGNPNAGPETADTFTVGLVWQPNFADGLSLTMDWWDIEITDSIQSIGTNVILSSCYDADTNSRQYCDRIIRDGNLFLTNVINTTGNIGGATAAGLDTTIMFDHSTSIGDWRYSLDLTYMDEYNEIQADGTTKYGLGYYDLGVFVDWKASFNLNWRNDNWMVNYNMRYIDSFIECEDDDCQAFESDAPNPQFREVDTYFQHDMQLGYNMDFNDSSGSITFGVQNMLDEEPPRVYNGFTAASDTATYDYIGRYFYLSYRHTM
jgi:outer membrane receptor protein involved in Fe transport